MMTDTCVKSCPLQCCHSCWLLLHQNPAVHTNTMRVAALMRLHKLQLPVGPAANSLPGPKACILLLSPIAMLNRAAELSNSLTTGCRSVRGLAMLEASSCCQGYDSGVTALLLQELLQAVPSPAELTLNGSNCTPFVISHNTAAPAARRMQQQPAMRSSLTSQDHGASASCSGPAHGNAFLARHLLHTGTLGCHTSCLLCQPEQRQTFSCPTFTGLA